MPSHMIAYQSVNFTLKIPSKQSMCLENFQSYTYPVGSYLYRCSYLFYVYSYTLHTKPSKHAQ